MCARDSLAPPHRRRFGGSASFHSNRTALHGNTPARAWSTHLLRAEVFIDWSTLPSMLRPWSGRSSQEDPSRRRVNLPMSARPRVDATWTSWLPSCGPTSAGEPFRVKYYCTVGISKLPDVQTYCRHDPPEALKDHQLQPGGRNTEARYTVHVLQLVANGSSTSGLS